MTHVKTWLVAAAITVSASAGCARPADEPKAEVPTLNVTDWTPRTELYMEHPPLVGGQSALFAVHLTLLDDFTALNGGVPSIEFTPEGDGTATVLRGSPPSRPGAFRVEGAAPPAGRYRWALVVDAPGLTDRHDLGSITVFPDEAAAVAEAGQRQPDDPAAIAYLKEQQWTNPFATSPAIESDLRTSIRVPATIEPVSGGEAMVAAPAAGRFLADSLAAIGTTVTVGQTLGRLEPRLNSSDDRALLVGDVAQARVAVDSARAEASRAERLLADRAVPARRVEDAQRALTSAEARLRAAEARLAQRDETLQGGGNGSGNAFSVRSPIRGRVAEVYATLGASFDEGAPLFKIVQTDRVELRAQIPAPDVAATRALTDVAFEMPGRPDAIPLRSEHRHDPGVIDPRTGALPVQFEVQNPGGDLLIGQAGTALLYNKDRARMLTVPKEAVLVESGRPYVFVQVGGERFARRYVEIAARDGDRVGVKSGIRAGERVVVRGAYDVQLASAAKGLPAEGHVH